jgi:two-component system, LytTR family, sensor kinase
MAKVVNDTHPSTNVPENGERPTGAAEPPPGAADDEAARPGAIADRAPLFRRMAVGVILIFWLAQFTGLSLMRIVRMPDYETWSNVQARAIVSTCAVIISFAILAILRAVRRTSLTRRALIALGLALAGAALHAAINLTVFIFYLPPMPESDYSLPSIATSYALGIYDFFWFHASITVMLLALTYGEDLVESEQRIAALQAQANSAQLKALRYQLNPHFLFNTLNSVASLISRRQGREAEAMVISLADFLRSTLRMDAGREIALSDEIQLQSLYLDIEQIRFPQRLHVTIDVPDAVRDALVPNLITQPLIENAIKYGVARSSEPVHLEIIARENDGKLSLEIRDDGGNAADGDPKGTQVGLRNVSKRLKLHFGDDGRFEAGRRPEGGFSARMTIPLRRA